MKARVLYAVSLLLAGGQLAAQQESTPSETSPHRDFVKIIAITPSIDTPLDQGKKVALEVAVEYELVSQPWAMLRVMALDGKRKTVAVKGGRVRRGRNTFRCEAKVKVPKAEEPIHLIAALDEDVQLQLSAASPDEIVAVALASVYARRLAVAAVQFEVRQGIFSALPMAPASIPGPQADPQTRETQNVAGHSTGLNFDPQGADFKHWVNRFKDEVYRNWIVPQKALFGGVSGHADLEFTVERNGSLSALRLLKVLRRYGSRQGGADCHYP